MATSTPALRVEPRWPAVLAIIATGLAYSALPDALSIGPRWLLLLLIVPLELPTLFSHRRGYFRVYHALGFLVSGLLTLFMILSLVLLVTALPGHRQPPMDLLLSAACLWICNVLVFAVWYWRLDAGGPVGRARSPGHTDGAFLFPQMQFGAPSEQWSPNFVDYLFLAFNTSTAFSPTDVPVLSRWAKILVMLQSSISLVTVATLAAHAINIL
jgi:hypothetical protein